MFLFLYFVVCFLVQQLDVLPTEQCYDFFLKLSFVQQLDVLPIEQCYMTLWIFLLSSS